jgi:hypothetical protein
MTSVVRVILEKFPASTNIDTDFCVPTPFGVLYMFVRPQPQNDKRLFPYVYYILIIQLPIRNRKPNLNRTTTTGAKFSGLPLWQSQGNNARFGALSFIQRCVRVEKL